MGRARDEGTESRSSRVAVGFGDPARCWERCRRTGSCWLEETLEITEPVMGFPAVSAVRGRQT